MQGRKKHMWHLVLFGVVAAAGIGGWALWAQVASNQVFVYEHTNYGGPYIRWDGFREIPDLRSYNTGALGTPNWNDRISSLKVGSEVKLIVYEHINYGGSKLTLTGPSNISSLVSSGWNDKISSLKIVPK